MRARIALAAALGAAVVVTLPSSVAGAIGLAAAKRQVKQSTNPILGFPESWGLNRRDVIDIGAGLAIVLLLVVVLVLRVRRRRRATRGSTPKPFLHAFPVTAEAWRGSGLAEEPTGHLPKFEASSVVLPPAAISPGWHPVQGSATKIAYWDGSKWAAFAQWDGSQWVDSQASVPASG